MEKPNLQIKTQDPFEILASTKAVLDEVKHVSLDTDAITNFAKKIGEYLEEHNEFPDHGHRLTGDREVDLQLIFFESTMGFCFWTIPDSPKWGIELGDGEKIDGWYGVCASFKRAYDEGAPVFSAEFFANATKKDIENIFRSATGADIPLLDERVFILNEVGRILQENFDGKFEKILEKAEYDVIKLVNLLIENFPSYMDVAMYNKREVIFLKLTHLLALDLEYRLTSESKRPFLKNFDKLSIFADYKLPQLLRAFDVLKYDKSLADLVDSYIVIPQGSEEEIEMRAGAIWGVELLRQELENKYSAIQIGYVIWLMSQDQELQKKIKPYHRTYTTFY